MSIHVHKTGLNKTTGRTGASIVTTNLIGNFDPGSVGSDANAWDNLVDGGNNLRRYNGITHNAAGGNPADFTFDGSDDYLGEASSGYGGTAFTFNMSNAFTCCGWFKHNNATHYAFAQKADTSNRWYLQIQNDEDVRLWVEAAGSDTFWTMDEFRHLIASGTWYYIAVSHDGSGNWKVYLNGGFLFSTSHSTQDSDAGTTRDPTGSPALEIGKRSIGTAYSSSGTKTGRVHIYSAQLSDSQIRQNFLASHDIYDARIYGADYVNT